LYEDLKDYFGPNGNYLILVDDANRLSQLSLVLRLLNEQTDLRKIKIVLTVRDYALRKVRNDAKQYNYEEVSVQKFSLEALTKILEDGFAIKNHDYIHRIHKVSDGNPRLAVMAARVALETNRLNSINDVSDLYDIYFESINDDLKELGKEDLIRAAGIISFFRTLDRTRVEDFESVAKAFGFTPDELWTILETLYTLEVVDLDFEVAKISDQILGTYLFYKSFFKDEVLDFSKLLSSSFQTSSYRLVDALNPILNTFDSKFIVEKLRPHVDRRWKEIQDDEEEALPFIRLFHFLKETEFLLYLKSRIDELPANVVDESEWSFNPETHQPVTDRYLKVLSLFQTENIDSVLDLIFAYLEKDLSLLPQVIHLLIEDFDFDERSHLWNYFIQHKVISKLIEKSRSDGSRLYQKIFLKVASKFTQMVFRSNTSSGLTVTIHTVPLRPVESMIELRVNLWRRVIELYDISEYQSDVRKIIQNYNQGWHKDVAVKEIVETDREILTPFIRSLNPESYEDCVLAQNYVDFLERVGVDFDASIRKTYTNKTYEISRLLIGNRRELAELGYEEYEALRKAQFVEYFQNYTLEDYEEFFRHILVIQQNLSEPYNLHQLHYPLVNVLVNLSESDPELFVEVVDSFLDSGNPIFLGGHHVVNGLLRILPGTDDVYDFLNRRDVSAKSHWLFAFFQLLPTDASKNSLEELYELYRRTDLREIPQSFDYLDRYLTFDSEVVLTVARILFERVKKGDGLFSFQGLTDYGDVSKDLGKHFGSDLSLLKEIYFYVHRTERYPDHKSNGFWQIFNLEKNFLFEYVEYLLNEKNSYEIFHDGSSDFSLLWDDDDFEELFRGLFEFVYTKESETRYFLRPSILELFLRNLDDEKKGKAITLLKEILMRDGSDPDRSSYIFQIISNCFSDKRREFLEMFLKENKNVDDFNRLPFDNNHIVMADASTRIPRLETKIGFYESLKPLFDSVDLMKHKLKIEETIIKLKEDIEDEQKRGFVGYF